MPQQGLFSVAKIHSIYLIKTYDKTNDKTALNGNSDLVFILHCTTGNPIQDAALNADK